MAPADLPAPSPGVPPAARWLLPALTLILALLAAGQVAVLVPRCVAYSRRLGVPPPGSLDLLLDIPEWLALAAALAVGGLAFWHRRSVTRTALLVTGAAALNVAPQPAPWDPPARTGSRPGETGAPRPRP